MIAIRTIKMPSTCYECPCEYDLGCRVLEEPFPDGFDYTDGRLPNCPLVEIDGETLK